MENRLVSNDWMLWDIAVISGEAAGLAMGLVMVGTKSAQAIEDMVAVSNPTEIYDMMNPAFMFP